MTSRHGFSGRTPYAQDSTTGKAIINGVQYDLESINNRPISPLAGTSSRPSFSTLGTPRQSYDRSSRDEFYAQRRHAWPLEERRKIATRRSRTTASKDSSKKSNSKDDGEEKDPNLVEWDGDDDPGNPFNWSRRRRWIITACVGLMTFAVTFASSVFSTGEMQVASRFNVSQEVAVLGSVTLCAGFCIWTDHIWPSIGTQRPQGSPSSSDTSSSPSFRSPWLAPRQNDMKPEIGHSTLEMDEQKVDIKELALAQKGFIYGILYLLFSAYPISFEMERGLNSGVGALPFISIAVGVAVGSAIIIASSQTRFKRKMEEAHTVVPEVEPEYHNLASDHCWRPNWCRVRGLSSGQPCHSTRVRHYHILTCSGLNYIIDVYKQNANSAIASNTFFRSWLGAGFPLFAMPMYSNLGTPLGD
ncbi:hypothetical protein MRB53_038801 [Persea americana]|nr:hypothetical protein MRB53_038801 [Persea americana]